MSEIGKWDRRYGEPGYAYGTDPNDFLVESIDYLPQKGRVLCLADGEGRNSVFLARHGFQVTAVDSSAVGMKKTSELARQYDVQVDTIVKDLADFTFEPERYDAIISIFCHLLPPLRKEVHNSISNSLRSGGVFLLEGYTPRQLQYNSGGPPVPELLMELEIIKKEVAPLKIIHGIELERNIKEGRLHTGLGSVVQLIAQK